MQRNGHEWYSNCHDYFAEFHKVCDWLSLWAMGKNFYPIPLLLYLLLFDVIVCFFLEKFTWLVIIFIFREYMTRMMNDCRNIVGVYHFRPMANQKARHIYQDRSALYLTVKWWRLTWLTSRNEWLFYVSLLISLYWYSKAPKWKSESIVNSHETCMKYAKLTVICPFWEHASMSASP